MADNVAALLAGQNYGQQEQEPSSELPSFGVIYRVTHQVALQMLSTYKQNLRFKKHKIQLLF